MDRMNDHNKQNLFHGFLHADVRQVESSQYIYRAHVKTGNDDQSGFYRVATLTCCLFHNYYPNK